MKKFFIALGSIFLAIIVLVAIGIAFVAVRGSALDKESKAYAEVAIPAIITNWSEKDLVDRASPEFNQNATQEQVDELFRWFSSLGRLRESDPPHGQSLVSLTSRSGKTISAQYVTKAMFEKGKATITLGLIKHGDHWQILRFDVRSPQLAPK